MRLRLAALTAVALLALVGCSGEDAAPPPPSPEPSTEVDDASPTPPPNPTQEAASGYRTVSNARYGFTCEVPAEFVTEGESDNGDGVLYTSPDAEVEVSCFGSRNLPEVGTASAQEALAESVTDHEAAGDRVTYQQRTGTAFTLSGTTATGEVFYERTAWGPGSTNTLRWTYPVEDKAAYDAAVQRTARTFRPGSLDEER